MTGSDYTPPTTHNSYRGMYLHRESCKESVTGKRSFAIFICQPFVMDIHRILADVKSTRLSGLKHSESRGQRRPSDGQI